MPGSHKKGPIVSEKGFSVGNKYSNTNIINEEGKLVGAPVWDSLLSAGVGYGGDYAGDSGVNVDLVDTVSGDHDLLIVVTVTEAFADDGSDDQAIFKLGDGTDAEAFMAGTVLNDAPLGYQFVYTGELGDGKKLVLDRTVEQGAGCTGEANIMAFVKAQ